MCIIAYKPEKASISEAILRECFLRNPDGGGISYVENQQLIIKKGIRNVDEFVSAVMPHMDKELVIHCRIASNGMVVNDFNCHPFAINIREDGDTKLPMFQYAVAHNGRLEWGHTNERSDTHLFTDQFLKPMFDSNPYNLTWEWAKIALERTILHKDRLNKMVIMMYDRKENEVTTTIINEKAGNIHQGVWFSNWSWDELTRPRQENKGFFGSTASSQKPSIGQDGDYRFWCEPDAHGWFWSFIWDAWINTNSYIILADHPTRKSPDYVNEKTFTRKDLGGRMILSKNEVNSLLINIYSILEKMDQDKASNVVKMTSYDPLEHLLPSDKALLCKKSCDIMEWSGEKSRKDRSKMNAHEKIKELRTWVKFLFRDESEEMGFVSLTEPELDIWILQAIKAGMLTQDCVDNLWRKRELKPVNN